MELLVVGAFMFAGQMQIQGNAFTFLFVFMGIGGIVHSMIDYNIAFFVVRALSKGFEIPIFRKAKETTI